MPEGPGAADLDRYLHGFERVGQRPQRTLLAGENQEIAIGAATGFDLTSDVPRDADGLLRR